MKRILVVLLFFCTLSSVKAQSFEYGDPLEVDKLLVENNLKKENMDAQDFNVAGMHFYDKKLWYEAEVMFLRAIELNRQHVLAYYNLACVLSIQFNDKTAKHSPILDYNKSSPFFYLYRAVRLDPNRMSRARNDSDFTNIRNYDEQHFDAITLPESQRPRYTYQVYFKESNSFEGDIKLVFVDGNGEEIWLAGGDKKLRELGFYSIPENAMPPYAIDNEEMKGKKFEIVIMYEPDNPSSLAGGYTLFKSISLLSIREL